MTVDVVNDPNGSERGRPETSLLGKFPGRRLDRSLPRFDLAAGELPQPTQQAAGGPTLHESSVVPPHHGDGRPYVGTAGGRGADRDRTRVGELPPGPTGEADGAVGARGRDRPADGLAELHHRLIELPRRVAWQQVREDPFEPIPDHRGPKVPLLPDPAGRDPQPVRFQRDHGSLIDEARDRPSDVRAHAR